MPADLLLTLGPLPLLEPLDHLVGGSVVAALFQVPVAGFRAEGVVGVGAIALAVLQDVGDSLPPGALALEAGGRFAEFAEPAGPLQLQHPQFDPAAPGQLTGAGLVGGRQAGVPLLIGQSLLLGTAGLALPVGGPVGLLAGQGRGGLGEGVLVAGLGQLAAVQQPPGALAEFDHPVAGRLLPGGGLGYPLLSVPALVGGVGEQPGAVGRGVAERGGDPVAFGA